MSKWVGLRWFSPIVLFDQFKRADSKEYDSWFRKVFLLSWILINAPKRSRGDVKIFMNYDFLFVFFSYTVTTKNTFNIPWILFLFHFCFFIEHYSILSFCKKCLLWFFFIQCRIIIVYLKNIDRLSDVQLTVIKLDWKGVLLLAFIYIIISLLVWVWWLSLAFSIRESTCSDCDQLVQEKGGIASAWQPAALHQPHTHTHTHTTHTHTHTRAAPPNPENTPHSIGLHREGNECVYLWERRG